jgi:hypothetical protein
VTREKNQRKTNGHAGLHDRTNGSSDPDQVEVSGHAPASTARGGISVQGDQAASDDASGAAVAIAATAIAAGADRQACADAAPPPLPGKNEMGTETVKQGVHLPGPTDHEAMQDGAAYVDAVAERVDLVAASVRLVQSSDEKIAKAELDRLREMKFGKVTTAAVEEPVRLDFGDLPRPQR